MKLLIRISPKVEGKKRNLFRFITCILLVYIESTCAAGFTIEELLDQALSSYPTVLSGQATKESAASEVIASQLRFLPTPSISTQQSSITYANQSSEIRPTTNFSLTQPIYTGGALSAGLAKTTARLTASDFSLLEIREDISRRLVSAYADWLRAYLKIQALEDSVQIHQKLVDLIVRRTDSGVSSFSDKDLGFSRLYQVKADLDVQSSAEASALATLSELVGQQLVRNQLVGMVATAGKVTSKSDGLLKALSISPKINRLIYEAQASEAEADEISGQTMPQISLQAQRQVGNIYSPDYPSFNTFGVVVQYTPGAGISSIALANAAKSRARAALFQVDVAKRELSDRLSSEYNEYEYSLLKEENLSRSASLADDIRASYDRQYLVGRKTWVEVMNAVRERTLSQIAIADTKASILGASRRLEIYIEGTSKE